MKLLKKVLATGIVSMLMFCMAAGFVGCNSEEAKNKKYDVSIRIESDDGDYWIFTPDIKELSAEREYDGKEHRFYVAAYQLVGHPRWGTEWFAPSGTGANVFSWRFLYTDLNGKQSVFEDTLKERGEYIYTCEARATSDLWNFRYINLHITVK